jgi:hypothetical protein
VVDIENGDLPIHVTDVTENSLQQLGLGDEAIKNFKHLYEEAKYWEKMFNKTTSGSETFFRVGSDGKSYEYVKQFYVIKELNKRYPGWKIKKEKLWYQPECRTWIFFAKLCVKYMLKDGTMMKRKIPGIGASFVHAKNDDPRIPVQPEDAAKATRTEWVKNAAYWLGIAVDVYEQEITEDLYNGYQEATASYGERNIVDTITANFESRGSFIKYCKTLPTNEQAEEVIEILKDVDKTKHSPIWTTFQKHNRTSVIGFINDMKAFVIKQKEKENGGTSQSKPTG